MRRLLLLVSAIIFVDALLFTALTPLVPRYADAFDLSKAGAGVLVGAYGAGAVLGGIPGGLAAARWGPKRTVVGALLVLAVASFTFASADTALALGLARFVQGIASTATWAGSLTWISLETPLERRGAVIGTTFGIAIFGAVLGPVFGGVAETVGIGVSFALVGAVTLVFAGLAAVLGTAARRERVTLDGLSRALRDRRFVGGLWLNMLPALLFGVLLVLTPLAFDDAGWSATEIALLFFAAGLVEVVLNPVLGRVSDRVGRLVPIRAGLAASAVAAGAVGLASSIAVLAALVCVASISFGSLYTPSMSLASHRAEVAGLAQGLAFGVVNTAWAFGELIGPTMGGALAELRGDAVPYLAGASLCVLTLAATYRGTAGKMRAHEA